jgi:hypothetical protein
MIDSWLRLTARLTARALVNPRLALDLLRTGWAFRRRDWWRKPPFLPIPDRTYLKWRMYTAYADENAVPPAEDVAKEVKRWEDAVTGRFVNPLPRHQLLDALGGNKPALIASGLMLGALWLFLSVYIKQVENFAGAMNFVMFPMFFFSSALYPLWRLREGGSEVLYYVSVANPFTDSPAVMSMGATEAGRLGWGVDRIGCWKPAP